MADRTETTPNIGEARAPANGITRTVLYRSDRVALYDVRCRCKACGPSAEELATTHHVVFPRAGVFVRHLQGREVLGDANHVLFFQRGEVYRVSHPADAGDDCTVLAFDPDLLLEVALACAPHVADRPEQPFARTHIVSEARLFHLHERLRQHAQRGAMNRLAVEEACLDLLWALLSRSSDRRERPVKQRASTRELHREQVKRAMLFLATRASDDLALSDVARAAHASEFHLARIFRRETGLTLHQYRTQLRLHTALARLVSGERDLARLASSLGFSSHSHFSDAFARTFGVPPSSCKSAPSERGLRELSRNLKVTKVPAP